MSAPFAYQKAASLISPRSPELAGAGGSQAGPAAPPRRRALGRCARGCGGAQLGGGQGVGSCSPGVVGRRALARGLGNGAASRQRGSSRKTFGEVAQIQRRLRLLRSCSKELLDSPAGLEELSPGNPSLAGAGGPARLN